jgi:mannitol-1-phosphate 5-dehydrogenase
MLVQFGAGNIGRGFIAPTFTQAGWTVVFIDIDDRRLSALAHRGGYQVIEVDGSTERSVQVTGVSSCDAREVERVAEAVAACDLCATAVGLAVLPTLARPLAAGLQLRQARQRGPLDCLVCENGVQAHTLLLDAVSNALPIDERPLLHARFGVVRTSIGRMIPTATGSDDLDIRVEPYCSLPVDAAGFAGVPPSVPHMMVRSDFDLVLQQKLYLHNLTHACVAYAGHVRGYATIPDCMDDPAIRTGAQQAGMDVCAALSRRHGRNPQQRTSILADCQSLVTGLMQRYTNRALNDPVARVARDPWRKLAADDRLVGAARVCLDSGMDPQSILWHILAACRYTPANDEPRAREWNTVRAQGVGAVLSQVSGLAPDDPLLTAAVALERTAPFPAAARH